MLQSEVASDQPAFVLTDWELIAAEIDSDVDATLGASESLDFVPSQ